MCGLCIVSKSELAILNPLCVSEGRADCPRTRGLPIRSLVHEPYAEVFMSKTLNAELL